MRKFPRISPWHCCLGVLGFAAIVLLMIGAVDMMSAGETTARATGVVLTALAVSTLTAIRQAWPDKPTRWRSAAVAASAMLLVSVPIAAATFPPRQPLLVTMAVAAAVVGLIAVATLFMAFSQRRTQPPVSGDERLSRGEMVTSATTLVAALVAAPIAWYSGYYLPNQTVPTVTIESEIGEVEAYGTAQATTTITIKATNTSNTSVRIVGSMYVLSGITVRDDITPGPSLDSTKLKAATGDDYGPSARYNTTTAQSSPALIQFGQVVWDQSTLVPNESTEITVVAFFPARQHDLLRLGTEFVIARDDRLTTGEPTPETELPVQECDGHQVIVRTWPLQHSSLVESLTQERTEVVLGQVVNNPTKPDWWPQQPYLDYQVQRTGHDCSHLFKDDADGLEDATMADMAGALAERLVPPTLATPE